MCILNFENRTRLHPGTTSGYKNIVLDSSCKEEVGRVYCMVYLHCSICTYLYYRIVRTIYLKIRFVMQLLGGVQGRPRWWWLVTVILLLLQKPFLLDNCSYDNYNEKVNFFLLSESCSYEKTIYGLRHFGQITTRFSKLVIVTS